MKHTLLIGASLLVAASSQMATAQEIATWKGFRTSAVSFTFDDNLSNQITNAVPLFDKYGYKATFNVVTNWVGNNWSGWKQLAQNGHEIASHTITHNVNADQGVSADDQLTKAKSIIKSNTGSECITIAYPNCNVPTNTTTLQNTYIGGRICNDQVEGKTPSDFYRIGSILCGSNYSAKTESDLKSHLTTALNKKGWCVYLIHEVDNGSGHSPLSSSAIGGTLKHINDNDNDFWCCTFADAIKYIKERDAAKASLKSSEGSTLTFTLTDNLDNSVYNYPISLRYKNPGWSKVAGVQGSKRIEAYIDNGYIYFDATPDAGDIVLSGDGNVPEVNPGENENNENNNENTFDPCGTFSSMGSGTKAQNGGTHAIAGGFNYEMWTESGDNASMEYTSKEGQFQFKCNWNKPNDLLCRIGLFWGGGTTPTYSELKGDIQCDFNFTKTGDGGGYNYIGIYGWTKSPTEVEYYIVENCFFSSNARQSGQYWNAKTSLGSYTLDGDTYELLTGERTGYSISGNSTFTQVYAVRKTQRSCGHISVSEHMRQWEKLGIKLGQLYDCKFLCEVGSGTGSFDLKYGNMWIGEGGGSVEPAKPSETEEPYKGAIAIPGTLQCEDYDKGGNGFGYYDTDNENEGGKYRNDGVDIVDTKDGGYAVGYTTSSEWLKYTIDVAADDNYKIEAYMANGNTTTPKITLAVDGNKLIQLTGVGAGDSDWDTYALAEGNAKLTKGKHTLKLSFDSDYTNIDYIKFTGTITANESLYADNISIYPNPANTFVEINSESEIKSVRFIDMLGRVTNFGKSKKIDTSSLNPGIYAVEIETDNATVVKKLTIKK